MIAIDGLTGAMQPATGQYRKTLADLRGIFSDQAACDALLAQDPDLQVYDVVEYRVAGSDLFFGTTTLLSGTVGGECFMTRGHFHARPDMGEVYYTQSGEGLLLLRTPDGATRSLPMTRGSCAHIPPGWAHRSVNTGNATLVFFWVCNTQAGQDYADIAAHGMGQRVYRRDGHVSVI